MTIKFPSQEWVEKYIDKINENEAYAKAAKNWEGDFLFVMEPDGNLQEEVTLYIDLWHGKARSGYLVTPENPAPDKVAYTYSGKYTNWLKLLNKEIDPIKGLMQRKFKLKGNMAKVLRAVKAAQELVNTTTHIEDVEFL